MEERKGRGTVFGQMEADMFNKFIDDTLLIDLPISGRLYTWCRGDGISTSRLYRFLCLKSGVRRGLIVFK